MLDNTTYLKKDQIIPTDIFCSGKQTQQISHGMFHGNKQVQYIFKGTFFATKTGSPSKTGKYAEPIRCRGDHCGKVFYMEYSNGFSWKCPFCGTVN